MVAIAPSIFSVDLDLSALIFPAGSCLIKILSMFHRRTGCPLCANFFSKVNFINSFRGFFLIKALLSKWLLVRSSDEWIELFTQVGIPVECANKIFDSLTYSKKSSDLYDFPLVRTKNKYMIVPALLNVAHPGKLLKSRFRQNDFNISHKGKLFEKKLNKSRALALLNFIDCEAHRELITEGLRQFIDSY